MAQSLALNKKAATASGSFHASIPLDAQERRVDPCKIREMRHAVGAHYFDFIPGLIVAVASSVGVRDLAIGAGDTERYLFAGMRAAVVIRIWGGLFKDAGQAG